MLKILLAALLATSTAAFADTAPSAADQGASAPAPKKHRFHAPKLRPGAKPAENPQASFDKKGGN